MKNLTVQIQEEQHEWLKRKAFEEDTSMAAIIRGLLDREMEAEGGNDE